MEYVCALDIFEPLLEAERGLYLDALTPLI